MFVLYQVAVQPQIPVSVENKNKIIILIKTIIKFLIVVDVV